jgi:outer membrane receptor protein involved in Fe transport
LLQGQVSGVQVHTSGEPGAAPIINIRGIGSFSDASPLYVIDGVPGGNIDYLSSADIESIDVLKDAASSAI